MTTNFRLMTVLAGLALAGCEMTVQAGACGPRNCTGCCTLDGQCALGAEPATCGSGGQLCTNCIVSGQICSVGQCVTQVFNGSGGSAAGGTAGTGGGASGGATGSCNASNCAGCCSEGSCRLGVFDTACGARGAACTSCGAGICRANPPGGDGSSRGGFCDSQGTGGGAAGCSESTCPTGCCDERGTCVAGTSSGACGTQGRACANCGSGACSGERVCMAGGGAGGGGSEGGGGAGGGVATAGGFVSGGGGTGSGSAGGVVSGGGFVSGGGGTGSGSAGGVVTGGGFVSGGGGTGSGSAGGVVSGGGFVSGGGGTGSGSAGGVVSGGGTAGGFVSGGGGSAGGVVSGTGETCATAVLLTSPGSVSGTLTGFANDYGSSASCLSADGPDRLYRLRVGMVARVSVTVTPTSSWDVSLSGAVGSSRCESTPRVCDASVNNAGAGASETIDLATAGDDVFVAVDTSATTFGGYTLSWSILPLTAGDRCELPTMLFSGTATSGTTATFTNDYTAGLGCATTGRLGADVVYAIQVGPGQGLDVRVAPLGTQLDTSISIATDLASCASQCVTSANTGGPGSADVAFWNNLGTTVTAYLIVDSSQGSTAGPFTITATVGGQVTCNAARCPTGCCQNNQCMTGSEDTACGQQGNSCQVCGTYQQCTNAVCQDTPRPTGSPCTLNGQCYSGSFATANCRATWPQGGYCSSTCLLDGYDCGGLPIIAPGWCVSGACLAKCSSPGTGQSDCRTDYVCEFSAGSGSQGVCVPRCQAVACASRTCQPSGYCR